MGWIRSWGLDLGDWCLAVLRHWVPYVTGGFVTACLLIFNLLQRHPITWVTWIWLVIALFWASFLAWKDGAKGRPKFCSYIKRVAFTEGNPTPAGALIAGRCFVSNHGAESTVHDWEVWANVDGVPTQGALNHIARKFALIDITDIVPMPMHVWPEQGIDRTRGVTFKKGDGHDYQFLALFMGLTMDKLDLASMKLHYKDAYGGNYMTEGAPRKVSEHVLNIVPPNE